jgi:CBS domain-containing protein
MTTDVKTENENENIMAVCKVMRDNNIGCVVVIKAQNTEKIPIGIITERDIVNVLGKLTIEFRTPLSSFMSKPIISIQHKRSIREAIQLMNSNNIRRLVVVDENNKLVGIITEKDIFRQIATSPSMVTDFVGGNYPIEHREVYQRFTDYIFDLLPKL